jgi:hypothetical protein
LAAGAKAFTLTRHLAIKVQQAQERWTAPPCSIFPSKIQGHFGLYRLFIKR